MGGDDVEMALLDPDGVIVAVNAAWEGFCRANGGDPDRAGPGTSYLLVCEAAGDLRSLRVAAVIRTALSGALPAPVQVLLPCDAPDRARWFDLLVASRYADDGHCAGAVVTLRPSGGDADPERVVLLEERRRLSRDLHDTVLQDLIAIGMQVEAGLRHADPARRDRDRAVVEQLTRTVQRLRAAVGELSEPAGRSTLSGAVRLVAADAGRALGHDPLVRITGPVDALPPHLQDELVAVVHEALSNVVRHARATATLVILTARPGEVRLLVEDDGVGLPSALPAGQGLANIRQRADDLGGRAEVGPGDDGGTRLVWTAPH